MNPALLYLSAANSLSQIMQDVVSDLVAEARARGSTWVAIGEALGVGDTAAQKKYRNGLDDERLLQLRYEANVVRQTALAAAGLDDDVDELLEELQGTTPAGRLEYSFGIIQSSIATFGEVEDLLNDEKPDAEEIWRLLFKVREKNFLAATTLLPDVEQWKAVLTWEGRAPGPHAENFYSPAAYIYLVMRQTWLAALWTGVATHLEDTDFAAVYERFARAEALQKQICSVLMRDDVQDALARALGNDRGVN